jgi:hypothetical protein
MIVYGRKDSDLLAMFMFMPVLKLNPLTGHLSSVHSISIQYTAFQFSIQHYRTKYLKGTIKPYLAACGDPPSPISFLHIAFFESVTQWPPSKQNR